LDTNQNIFREFYYGVGKVELYKVLEHQYELIEPEGENENNNQSKLISLVTRMEIINQLMLSQDELEFLKHHLK
jgi:hypothetical protein